VGPSQVDVRASQRRTARIFKHVGQDRRAELPIIYENDSLPLSEAVERGLTLLWSGRF
jgi:hypothetical protein